LDQRKPVRGGLHEGSAPTRAASRASGRPIEDGEIETLAADAERGYDVNKLIARPEAAFGGPACLDLTGPAYSCYYW
jgi:hypothetical protein